jgi:hypothetical protein
MSTIKNVVLVHGSFVDGAGWESVFHLLTRRGYNVSVVQIPTTTLVGHSYGGVVPEQVGSPQAHELCIQV